MSASFKSEVVPEISLVNTYNNHKPFFKQRHFIKSKENICKPKHCRELKKKLKKYKLRRDGQEDQEVLDVSQILVTSLKIKSPNYQGEKLNGTEEVIRPKNYLFKMGRRKKVADKIEGAINNVIVKNIKQDESTLEKNGELSLTFPKINTKTAPSEKKSHENQINKNDVSLLCTEKDRKQTNAFQLMMDSRNKSIGSNSPGKEKAVEESEIKEAVENRNIKAKRMLALQKMAEAKGSLQKKEMEDYQEQCIKKKMDKRAERLKNMILKKESKKIKKENVLDSVNRSSEKSSSNRDINISAVEKKLTLVDLFQDISDKAKNCSPEMKKIPKEDVEFLKKLSPSIKKKENMLCYFEKIGKNPDDSIIDSEDVDRVENNVIKVKLSKSKKKVKKRKLSLKKETDSLQCLNTEKANFENGIDADSNNEIISEDVVLENKNSDEILDNTRPIRNVKRPAKYTDEFALSSSDEELHIFTPKKKKHVHNGDSHKEAKNNKDKQKITEVGKQKEFKTNTKKDKLTKDDNEQKKPSKLAPIFNIKLDAAALEAKQRFLSSGVPDKLKKVIEKERNVLRPNIFTPVVHIQQMNSSILKTSKIQSIKFREADSDVNNIKVEADLFRKLLVKSPEGKNLKDISLISTKNKPSTILHNIKQLYPKFPVYRTYRLLKEKSRGEYKDCSYPDLDNSIEVINGMIDLNNDTPDKINWTDKYKPMSSKQIISNIDATKELKNWLVTWTEYEVKYKKPYSQSDSSDFCYSDTDSKESLRSFNNLIIITGPVGSGKTSIVYAVAAELAIKVLEVNASSKRTGKIMLQDLQEATQSHKVNRGKNSQEIKKSQGVHVVINVDEPKKPKKRGRKKRTPETTMKATEISNEVLSQTTGSQESLRHCMSLILVDDADIVFEQDDGFCSGIVQLAQCSKRPVILVTSSTTCPHLQRFVQTAKIIHIRPLLPRILGIWIDLLCLTEYGSCWPGLGARILDYFKGDIRKTINFLQFNLLRESTLDDNGSQNTDCNQLNIEDENSNMSWSDREGIDEKLECPKTSLASEDIWQYFVKTDIIYFDHPLKLFNIWWNIPRLLHKTTEKAKSKTIEENDKRSNEELKILAELEEMSKVIDTISISDFYRHRKIDNTPTLIDNPWLSFEMSSVSEQESFDNYDRHYEIMDDISHTLITSSIRHAQNSLDLERKQDLISPSMAVQRERDRITSRHNHLTSYLNASSALDRRALALDYWSNCRTICRIEKSKTDSNFKRNNRFFHYLKSLNVMCKTESFDNLCNSLCYKK